MNHLLAAGEHTGARHQVILSIVGVSGDVLTARADGHVARTHYRDWLQTAP